MLIRNNAPRQVKKNLLFHQLDSKKNIAVMSDPKYLAEAFEKGTFCLKSKAPCSEAHDSLQSNNKVMLLYSSLSM